MRYSYSIIDTIISIEEQIWTDKVLRKFSVKKEKQNELEIRGISEKMYSGNIQLFNIEKWHYNMFRFNSDVMFVDLEKKRGDIVLPFFEQRNVVTLIMQLFYANVIKKKVLQLHASIIEKNAYGIMFLGPSGIGKTTQAELWNKFCDALIINGDIVFVEEKENVFLGWGTPWHGSSPYCENTFVPVKG